MGVFPSRPEMRPFLPFRKNTRFIWYYCFVKKQVDHIDTGEEEIPKLLHYLVRFLLKSLSDLVRFIDRLLL